MPTLHWLVVLWVVLSHLIPEHLDTGQHGAGGDEPAVAQLALRDVTGTDAVHEQTRLLTDLLQ